MDDPTTRRQQTPDPEQYLRGLVALPDALRKVGFSALRQGQHSTLKWTMLGIDQISVMPTSGGKSACYYLPTICLGWKTLVFSPLVSLIKDQWSALCRFGFRAGAMSSGFSEQENALTAAQWEQGQLDFLLLAPERTGNLRVREMLRRVPPNMIVCDEAHCLSQWGFNFRPSYQKIGELVKELSPRVILALTATMTPRVEADIRNILGCPHAHTEINYYKRENLDLRSMDHPGEMGLIDCVNNVPGSTIVYFSTVKTLEECFAKTRSYISGGVTCYHGQMGNAREKDEEGRAESGARESAQNAFMAGTVRVVYATNAFGLGIDKPDVRAVIHYQIPGSIDALSQEIGRGGRDGLPSLGLTFYSESARRQQENFILNAWPSKDVLWAAYKVLKGRADKEGFVRGGVREAFQQAGISDYQMRAISSILRGAGVTEDDPEGKNFMFLRVLRRPANKAQEELLDQVTGLGVSAPGGLLKIDVMALAEIAELSLPTVKKKLKRLHEDGIVDLPERTREKPLKLVGDLSIVDWAALDAKRSADIDRLSRVLEYCRLPNEHKHEFLAQYFATG